MAIALTTSGGLYTRLGHLGGLLNDQNALRGGSTTSGVTDLFTTKVSQVLADYAASVARKDLSDGMYTTLASWQAAQAGFLTALKTLGINTMIAMASDDSVSDTATMPRPDGTLATALKYLIAQMKANSNTVNQSVVAVAAQSAVGSPVGNPQIVSSTKDTSGLIVEYALPEALAFRCSADSQTGGQTSGNEQFTFAGATVISDVLSWLWPGGSGATGTLAAVNGAANNAQGNLLQNSDFVTYTTTDNPDNWTILVGVATTNVANGTATPYTTGGGGVRLVGDGSSTLSAITQKFSTTPTTTVGAGGTNGAMTPLTEYALNCWIRCSATPAAGVLEFSLIDNNGNTIADAQSVNNLFTKSLTAVSTAYVNVNGVFRTPAQLPSNLSSNVRLKVRLSTAIDSGKWVDIGRLSLSKMTQVYQGGPFFSICSGNTALLLGDSWISSVTNTRGGFQGLFQKFFNMPGLGIILPSNVSPSISDGLIS